MFAKAGARLFGCDVNAEGTRRNSELLSYLMTDMAQQQGVSEEEARQQFLKTMRPTTAINQFTTSEEVANMVVYVCSEQASATTGAALRVDGGAVRSIA